MCARFAFQLESEIIDTQQTRHELEQHCQDLRKVRGCGQGVWLVVVMLDLQEKQELKERLEVSERKLQETQKTENRGDEIEIERLDLQQK